MFYGLFKTQKHKQYKLLDLIIRFNLRLNHLHDNKQQFKQFISNFG